MIDEFSQSALFLDSLYASVVQEKDAHRPAHRSPHCVNMADVSEALTHITLCNAGKIPCMISTSKEIGFYSRY